MLGTRLIAGPSRERSTRQRRPRGLATGAHAAWRCGDPCTVCRAMLHARIDISEGLDGEPVVLACFDLGDAEIAASAHAVAVTSGERFRTASLSVDDVLELRELTALVEELRDLALRPGISTVVRAPRGCRPTATPSHTSWRRATRPSGCARRTASRSRASAACSARSRSSAPKRSAPRSPRGSRAPASDTRVTQPATSPRRIVEGDDVQWVAQSEWSLSRAGWLRHLGAPCCGHRRRGQGVPLFVIRVLAVIASSGGASLPRENGALSLRVAIEEASTCANCRGRCRRSVRWARPANRVAVAAGTPSACSRIRCAP